MHPASPLPHEPELRRALDRVLGGRSKIHLPAATGLHRRRPESHFHATPEFFFQAGGACDFECPSGNFRVRTGDVCVIPAGVPHAETPIHLKSPYRSLVLMNHGFGFIALGGIADEKQKIQSVQVSDYPFGGQAFQCLELLHSSRHREPQLRREYLRGLVAAFLSTILSEMHHPTSGVDTHTPAVVREAEKMVRVDISKAELSVRGIAAELGISADHLTRLFRKARGQSFAAWITRERVALAKDLLLRPGHNVAEVGWTCGFSSSSYFIRIFRTHTGSTPKEWRQRTSQLHDSI